MLKPPKYDLIRKAAKDELRLTTGASEDRLLGLRPLLEKANGLTILDIGCHVGTIAEAFAQQGAALIHVVDLYRPGVRKARDRLQAYETQAVFKRCDLAGGMSAIRIALPPLRPRYDIVLYLGMHHHMVSQMSAADLAQFVDDLLSSTDAYFAVRTSARHMGELHKGIVERQFGLWAAHEDYPRPVGPLRIYRRL